MVRLIILIVFLSGNAWSSDRLFYENWDDTPSEQFTMTGCITYSEFDHVGRTDGAGVDGDHAIVEENYDGGAGYCSRINYLANGTGLIDQWEDVGESSTGEHYLSYWYRLDSSYGLTGGWSHKDIRFWHSAIPQSELVMEKHIYGPAPYPMDIAPGVDSTTPNNGGSPWGFSDEPDHAAEFVSGIFAWHHVEIWIKYDSPAGSGNGEFKIWIDDIVQLDETSVIFTKTGYPSYTRFSVPSNATMTGATAPNYYFTDEVEIWDGMPESEASIQGISIIGVEKK